MKTAETHLLARADRMSDSTLVRLSDWEVARLRVAMLHQLEDTLTVAMAERARGVASGRRGPAAACDSEV